MIFKDINQSGCDYKLSAILEKMKSAENFNFINNIKMSLVGFKNPPKYKKELEFHWLIITDGKVVGLIETVAGNATQTWSGSFRRTVQDIEVAQEKLAIKKQWAHDHNLPCLFLTFNDIVNTKFCTQVLENFLIRITPKTGSAELLDKIFELSKIAENIKENENGVD